MVASKELPTLEEIRSHPSAEDSPLALTLGIFFETSPILSSILEPQISTTMATNPPSSYAALINTSLEALSKWGATAQASFIAGHPRIGEVKNLSGLSAKEQGGKPGVAPTPPEVLTRLKHLNSLYEAKYPGLIYITFVNGRSRAAIAEEMEDMLGLEHTLSPDQPSIDVVVPVDVDGKEWRSELSRAVRDIGLIAKSRLGTLGVE